MAIDLDALMAQRQEATGVEGNRVPFTFKGDTFTFKDPFFLTDEELEELDELPEFGPDVCAWFMGEEEYDRFITAGGSSNLWAMAHGEHIKNGQDVDSSGKRGRMNRSRRRAATRRR